MILDKLLMFSEKQAVTASAASTDVIDLGPIDGIGTRITSFLSLSISVACSSAISFQSCASAIHQAMSDL